MQIHTPRLVVRRLRLQDSGDYHAIFGNPHIARYDDFKPIPLEEAVADVQRIVRAYADGSPEQEFGVELKSESRVIGILCYKIDEGQAFIGFHFNESYHGHGYACEAVTAYLPWLASDVGLPIAAVVDPDNGPSIYLLRKQGFVFAEARQGPATSSGPARVELLYRLPPEVVGAGAKAAAVAEASHHA